MSKKWYWYCAVVLVFSCGILTIQAAPPTTDEFYQIYRSAEQGNAEAQNKLADLYYFGEFVQQDYDQAAVWFQKSADQGNAEGQYNVGVCYQYGRGRPESYEDAVYWYRKSAEQGYHKAQYRLGWCYENGKGVPEDKWKALELYAKSADQGNEWAQKRLLNDIPSWMIASVLEKTVAQFCKTEEKLLNYRLQNHDNLFTRKIIDAVEGIHPTVTVSKVYVSDLSVKTKDGGEYIGELGDNIRSIKLSVTILWDGNIQSGGKTIIEMSCENADGEMKIVDSNIAYTNGLKIDFDFGFKVGYLIGLLLF